jgi:CBS domain-containing protein
MQVKDLMIGTPCYCLPETNLASATELMWNANCGCLPVLSADGKVSGVITDRDICVALGTRNRVAGDVTVGEVISGKVHSCAPEDEIHLALQTFREARVRRLPVVGRDGSLAGLLSMDDILSRAEPKGLGKEPELSTDEVIRTFRSIALRRAPEVVTTRTAAA